MTTCLWRFCWPGSSGRGPTQDFYRAIGVSQKGMASIIGKAKKLRREGHFPAEEFKEIKIEAPIAGDRQAMHWD